MIELDSLFATLTKEHDFMTSDAISSHILALIHLVILTYVTVYVSPRSSRTLFQPISSLGMRSTVPTFLQMYIASCAPTSE